jgi:hypothetical protein
MKPKSMGLAVYTGLIRVSDTRFVRHREEREIMSSDGIPERGQTVYANIEGEPYRCSVVDVEREVEYVPRWRILGHGVGKKKHAERYRAMIERSPAACGA